jgi:hypothetical protein
MVVDLRTCFPLQQFLWEFSRPAAIFSPWVLETDENRFGLEEPNTITIKLKDGNEIMIPGTGM